MAKLFAGDANSNNASDLNRPFSFLLTMAMKEPLGGKLESEKARKRVDR